MSSETEMFDYLRNVNTRPGPNAGKSIDPTQPGPDADRIAELAEQVRVPGWDEADGNRTLRIIARSVAWEIAGLKPLDGNDWVNTATGIIQKMLEKLARLRNEQRTSSGDPPYPSDDQGHGGFGEHPCPATSPLYTTPPSLPEGAREALEARKIISRRLDEFTRDALEAHVDTNGSDSDRSRWTFRAWRCVDVDELINLAGHALDLATPSPATSPGPQDVRVDTQVWTAAREMSQEQKRQPEWLWFSQEWGAPSFGRWPKNAEKSPAPYIRADIAFPATAHSDAQPVGTDHHQRDVVCSNCGWRGARARFFDKPCPRCEVGRVILYTTPHRPDASGLIAAAALLDRRADQYTDNNEQIEQGYRMAARYLRARAPDRSAP